VVSCCPHWIRNDHEPVRSRSLAVPKYPQNTTSCTCVVIGTPIADVGSSRSHLCAAMPLAAKRLTVIEDRRQIYLTQQTRLEVLRC
jgi:hypothetical protein